MAKNKSCKPASASVKTAMSKIKRSGTDGGRPQTPKKSIKKSKKQITTAIKSTVTTKNDLEAVKKSPCSSKLSDDSGFVSGHSFVPEFSASTPNRKKQVPEKKINQSRRQKNVSNTSLSSFKENVEPMNDSEDDNEGLDVKKVSKNKKVELKDGGSKEEQKVKQENKKRKTAKIKNKDVNMLNVEELLALGEGQDGSMLGESEEEGCGSHQSSDWEEVQETKREHHVPAEGVDITLNVTEWNHKKKRQKVDIKEQIMKQFNRVRKSLQIRMHKVHLLCLLGHCLYVNKVLNSQTLTSLALSVIPINYLKLPKKPDVKYVEKVMKWFSDMFSIKEQSKHTNEALIPMIIQSFDSKIVSKESSSLIFVSILRTLGLKARLVMSLQVMVLKPGKDEFMKIKEKKDLKVKEEVKQEIKSKVKDTGKKRGASKVEKKQIRKLKPVKYHSDESEGEKEDKKKKIKTVVKKKLRKCKRSVPVLKSQTEDSRSDSDSEFKPSSIREKKVDRRVLSSDDEVVDVKKKQGCDVWVEVYLESASKWVCIDVLKNKVDCISELSARATQPVLYIIAANNDSTLKDVTKRYVLNWHSETRKQRVESKWWEETFALFTKETGDDEDKEDEDIMKILSDQPLPKVISEFKNHPLYVLKRHLLKYEAIYPVDAPTFGFIRGEAVFARECVHILRSREKWYNKEARVVRAKSDPYKTVQTTKYDKLNHKFYRAPLELYGMWQTDEYDPPTAVDGIVPRNEYGNVELFKPCMLPKGTVHLQNPGLFRLARKMNIDCANAVIGFDFHCGACHPVMDGIIVCEEFKDQLLDAWDKEVEEAARKSEEKREKRIWGNWRKLIRGLLIREKLKMKYAFGEKEDEDEKPLSQIKNNRKTL